VPRFFPNLRRKRAMQKKDKKNLTLKEKIADNVYVFFSAYLIAFVIRLFILEGYQIPSESMVPSLLVKDIMMVEKITLGPRIPVINLKMPGFFKPGRNDIFAFEAPQWKNQGLFQEILSLATLSTVTLDNNFENPKNLVKRLIGLPGDRISMTNRILTVNGNMLRLDYINSIQEVQYNENGEKVNYFRDYDLYNESCNGIKRVVQHVSGKLLSVNPLVNQFPEIYVPKKGDVINLNQNSYYQGLLLLLIRRESLDTNITLDNGKFYKDGLEITEWKVRQNYYFGMGDNRDDSLDSRYFGFIPEDNIIGRPVFRYFPFNRIGFDLNETDKAAKNRQVLD
jgi:signal peptidase I